jgi:oligopeptidase A
VDKKAEFAALQQKLSHLSTQFSENLLDATHAWTLPITEPKQLAGLPPQALALAAENAKQRNLLGWVFTLDYPSYSTALKYLDDRSLRQQIYEAYATRASDRGPYAGQWDNSTIMDEIMATRHRLAQLVGFPNYAEYSLATKMAKTPTEVLQFLENLITKTRSIALQEKAALTAYAQNLDGITTLEAWDLAYYAEKLRESQFHFTQEAVRPYFPINKVLAGLFAITEKLYGVSIQEEKGIDIWHPDVRFFIIRDEDTGTPRGGFYIDLYARSHKRDGAWMDDCRVRRKLQNDAIQLPVAYLTCNFMPPVNNQPALLTHDDVLTLFHEFGHGLHHMLTKVDYAPVSGINGVPWDAVEFPSQFMENWCWEKETLALISEHYQTHEPIPDDLYQKLVAAKLFHTGLQMLRQLEFSLFDFRLHLEFDPQKPHQIQHLLDEIRAQTAVFPVPEFNRFQQSFSHVFAGGYAAGYYSYKWAEVLSADAYAQFEEKKDAGTIFNHSIGRSFLKNILESGGVRDPRDAFIAFRGREPHIDALLKHSGLEI